MKHLSIFAKRALELLLLSILTLINYFAILLVLVALGSLTLKIAPSLLTTEQESFVLLELLILIPAFISIGYSLLCLTPFSSWLVRVMSRFKPLSPYDNYRISEYIKELNFKKKLKFYTIKDSNYHVVGVGKNSLAFSSTALENCSEEELKGAICHNLKHFELGDNRFTTLFFSIMQLSSRLFFMLYWAIEWVLKLILGLLAYLIPALRKFSRKSVKLWRAFYLLFFNMIYVSLFIVYASISRKHEYLCDSYVTKSGYADGLISFLEKKSPYEQSIQPTTYVEYVSNLHPAILRRIYNLQNNIDFDEK